MSSCQSPLKRTTGRPRRSVKPLPARSRSKTAMSISSREDGSLFSTQRANSKGSGSKRVSTLYSCSRRYLVTSNWSSPTAPITMSPSRFCGGRKSCTEPSCASSSRPFLSCFRFIGSSSTMRTKLSGAKWGISSKLSLAPPVTVSPISKIPGS